MTQTTEELLAERGSKYGDYAAQAALVEGIMDLIHASPNGGLLPAPVLLAFHMIALKIGRSCTGDFNNADNYADIAGYATLAERYVRKPTA